MLGRHKLSRGGVVTKFMVCDVKGFEKTFRREDVLMLNLLWQPYVHKDHRTLLEAYVDQLATFLVRAPSGHITCMSNFNPSGNPWTTHVNNRMALRHIASAFAAVTGYRPVRLLDYLSLAIYGDDLVIGVTDEAAEVGFVPSAVKQYFHELGITLKSDDEFLPFEQIDFLSFRFTPLPGTHFLGPCPTRVDKLKLSALVRTDRMSVSQHFSKVMQIRNLVVFNDELYEYYERVLKRFYAVYYDQYHGNAEWVNAEQTYLPRDQAMRRLVGIELESGQAWCEPSLTT